ncbi:MAG TPA: hypothetical protein VMG58_15810 [Candidatus Sulfotelmatobacter sp.]|nr:hypothetical protein [Candidatus Sulfotelmatobacter sp.]
MPDETPPVETELQRVRRFWAALQPALAQEQCRSCECLQGALVELRLALEELPDGPERDPLLDSIQAARGSDGLHGCLECTPCDPGDLLAAFYRAQAAGRCGCGESCAKPAPNA